MRTVPVRVLGVLFLCATIAAPAVAVEIASGLEAIEAPRILVKGRVLLRDGITGVERANLRMSNPVLGITETARSGRGGRFRIRLPAGEYRLSISRLSEIYESPSLYRIVPGGDLSIDFLLLRDFDDSAPRPAPRPVDSGPAPRREPAVVGTVVDVIRDAGVKRRHRWREALAFLGSLLAVAVAAD